jgi:hypothetical protein
VGRGTGNRRITNPLTSEERLEDTIYPIGVRDRNPGTFRDRNRTSHQKKRIEEKTIRDRGDQSGKGQNHFYY